ncbi:Flp pilus assembly protein CpaB [Aliidiomarina minuta]|uniref:Flp pilus assembly protein CpaB n=1 Tax=Aliidiomarina minuta TaxID=880057 RepID=A0A432W5T4_9GAMM|nr:Flp pilus assembly protein CpaB [Aliidiomarina minuta]RUO25346.1 Flp pilus assembly protein CpaB [Aliidiomarina minuta]
MKYYLSWRLTLPLVCGIISALIALWLINQHINKRLQEASLHQLQVAKTEVVVPATNLTAGTQLHPSLLQVRKLPSQALPADSIFPAQAAQLFGRYLATEVAAGKPLQQLHIEQEIAQGLAALLRFGQRAFSIPVSNLESNAGLIRPGDRLDIYQLKNSGYRPLLSSVSVLAVGNQWHVEGTDVGIEDYRSLTLAVDARQVPELELLSRQGALAFWLRNKEEPESGMLPAPSVTEIIVAGQFMAEDW